MSTRVCTSTCTHDWKPIPGYLGHFKCALCMATGSRSVRTLAVPFNRNIKGTKTPDRVIVMSAHYDHVGMRAPGVKGDCERNMRG